MEYVVDFNRVENGRFDGFRRRTDNLKAAKKIFRRKINSGRWNSVYLKKVYEDEDTIIIKRWHSDD